MIKIVLSIFLALCVLPLVASAQGTVDLYIFAGQSNADGRGEVSDLSDAQLASLQSDAIISYLNPGSERERAIPMPTGQNPADLDVGTNGFVDLVPDGGFSGGFSVDGTSARQLTPTFGAELSFAASIAEATGSDNQIAIVKVTRGGASLRNDFLPTSDVNTVDDEPQGFLYRALIDQITASITELESQGNTVNVKGFLWHQGESDTGNSGRVGNYTSLFTDLVEGVRETVDEDIPVVIGQLGQDRTSALNDVFNTTVASFANSTDGISIASSVGVTNIDGDPTHFDANGQILLGERFAAAFGPNEDDFASFTIDNADTDLDSAGVGGTVTAVSDNGVNVTLTTTDITGFVNNTEGSALSSGADAGHVTNINNGSLGVNSVGNGGHSASADSNNFNPGESLTFVLDQDIELLSIDLQSFDAAGENNGLRISADDLTFEITRDDLPLNADGTPEDATNFDFVFPEGLFVTAGTEITFEAFSTTGEFNVGADDSFRIQDFSFNVISSVPEPSSLAILGLLGSLAAFRRRR